MHAQQAEREARALREELDQELDQARKQLMGRLSELEPLPDALRRTELQLQEAQEKERVQERRNAELTTGLAELRIKVCVCQVCEREREREKGKKKERLN